VSENEPFTVKQIGNYFIYWKKNSYE